LQCAGPALGAGPFFVRGSTSSSGSGISKNRPVAGMEGVRDEVQCSKQKILEVGMDVKSIFGNDSQAGMARKTGVVRQSLNAVANGRRGLSTKAAEAVAPEAKESAPGLFAATNALAIARKKREGAQPGETLREVGRVFGALKSDFAGEQVDLNKDTLLSGGLELLQELGEEALAAGASVGVDDLGRTGLGVKKSKTYDPSRRQAEERPARAEKAAGEGTVARLGRNPDGTSRRKIM
jgi:hypothetical protein